MAWQQQQRQQQYGKGQMNMSDYNQHQGLYGQDQRWDAAQSSRQAMGGGRGNWAAPGHGRQGDHGAAPSGGPRTDLYFASLPIKWDESEIKAFHRDAQCDVNDIVSVKLFEPRRAGVESRAAIIRYISHSAAARTLQLIQRYPKKVEVRFAEEKSEKGGGKGNGYDGQAAHRWTDEDYSVPVKVGLRVRNCGTGQVGTVVACKGHTPGVFRVRFDSGQEWEWEVKRFESEDGWPLQDRQAVPATIGLRVRCWMDGRCGRIAYIHNEWPQRIWVVYDDSDEGEKDVSWFFSEETWDPVGPGLTQKEWHHRSSESANKGGGKHHDSHSYGSSKGGGKGGAREQDSWWEHSGSRYEQDRGFDWQERPPMRNRNQDSKKWESQDQGGKGKKQEGKGKSSKGEGKKESGKDNKDAKGGGKGKGEGKSKKGGGDSSEAEAQALREVVDQLLDESNAGRVWIVNWPGRFQSKLGQLREFLERHPDKFKVVPENGRRYTVEFSTGHPPAGVKPSKPKGGKEKAPKWKARVKPEDEEKTAEDEEKDEKEEETVGADESEDKEKETDVKEPEAKLDDQEEEDDPVEDAMRSREKDEWNEQQEPEKVADQEVPEVASAEL
eukprot:TRINITY_DN10776_c0_g1_i1.p1 TRINITY_DN10776_c0_g1~~TRINITY_DN10776_c0_g1_i1.p1  ORF type:complete len:609 (-),score=150.85 TRINITY_DN10776_c0_g1_i1:82-1908(-)